MHQLFHSDSTTCVAHDNIQMKDIPIKKTKKNFLEQPALVRWDLFLDVSSLFYLLTGKFLSLFHKIIKMG